MDDRDIETLLAKYRPGEPPAGLQASIHQLTTSPTHQLTWPWAVAAAALLAIAIGLHVRAPAATDFAASADRDRRAETITAELGGSAADRLLARAVTAEEDRLSDEAEIQRRRSELTRQ